MVNSKILKIRLIRIISKILIFSLILVFLFKLINIQNKNIQNQKKLEEYTNELEETKAENEKLIKEINEELTDEYKEKYAREHLNMIKKGERVIYDVTKE